MTNIPTSPVPASPTQTFETIKKIDENGIEYWKARELMVQLDYAKWSNFAHVIEKAQVSCTTSGQHVLDHFADIGKMFELPNGAKRKLLRVGKTRKQVKE